MLLLLSGCGGDGVPDPLGDMMGPAAPTLSEVQATLFTPRCAFAGCHAGTLPAAGMTLEPGFSFGALVAVRSTQNASFFRVDPGNPDDSYLTMKVSGDPRISFQRMPLVGATLTAAEIGMIRDWILDGARDN